MAGWTALRSGVTALAVLGLVAVGGPAQAGVSGNGPIGSGSLLVDETFTGATVDDDQLSALGDACLTAATAPAAGSGLGSCTYAAPAADTDGGWLQLTSADLFRSGAVLANRTLPASAGLVVQFDQYQYGGSGGGDGIGFFLVDGTAAVTAPGSNGSGLGYSQRTYQGADLPGVSAGYLGVGVDAVGGFAVDDEGKGAGCASPSPHGVRQQDTVTVRGPGQGMTGYCWLATGAVGGAGSRGADLEGALRTVRVTVSDEALPLVTVEVDRHDTTGWNEVLQVRMTTAPPPTYRFGLSASTGTFSDVHLVRNLRVGSVQPLGDPDLYGEFTSSPADGVAYAAGETVTTRYVVTNTAPGAVSGVAVTSTSTRGGAADPVSCPRSTLGAAGSGTASMVCTSSHLVTTDDLQRGPAWATSATVSATPGGGPARTSAPVALTTTLAAAPPVVPAPPTTALPTTAPPTTAPPASAGPAAPQLARTGAAPVGALWVGGALLVVGIGLSRSGRRRPA